MKMADDVKDTTNQNVDDSLSKELAPEVKKAVEVNKQVSDMLELYGIDSVKDIEKSLKEFTGLSKVLGDKDISKVIEKAERLDYYEDYWNKMDAEKKSGKSKDDDDDDLDDEEKEKKALKKELSSLKDEIKSIKDGKQKELSDKESQKAAQEAINNYSSEIKEFTKRQEVPEEYGKFVNLFFGIDNPFNEVDITNTVEVRKMLKGNYPTIQEFEQAVIKRYLDGKVKIPEMSENKPANPDDDRPKVKNLKDARAIAKEMLTKAFNKR